MTDLEERRKAEENAFLHNRVQCTKCQEKTLVCWDVSISQEDRILLEYLCEDEDCRHHERWLLIA